MSEVRSGTELVELVHADPSAGWAAIWDQYGDALHRYARRLLDDPADAEDAVSDTFVLAADRIGQLRDGEALRAWLYSICRRCVQQRWRQRARLVPVDPQETSAMTGAVEPTAPAGDAGRLLAAAAEGLSIDDRELLALAIDNDLDTTAIARITGEKVNAVSVRVSRLKDSLGRAAGAMLVARHHRRDCTELDGILASWDGTFDPLWRKRIARHIDACEVCEDRRRGAAAMALSAAFAVPITPDGLRERVLERISHTRALPVVAPGGGRFPEPEPWTPAKERRRIPAGVLAAAVVAIVVVVAAIAGAGDGGDDGAAEVATESPAETTTTSRRPSATSTSVVALDPRADGPTITVAANTSTTGRPASTTTTRRPGITSTTVAPVVTTTTAPAVTTTTTAPTPAPTVSLALSPSSVETGCGQARSVSASINVTGSGAVNTVISWDGPDGGSVAVAGTGGHTRQIGPFTQVSETDGTQTITVTARTTDGEGRVATQSRPLQVSITPC